MKMYRVFLNLCLVALHMGSSSVRASPVIDGESLYDTSDKFKFVMPASCEGKNFCFDRGYDYSDYTKYKIEALLDQLPLLPFNDRIGTATHEDCDLNNECETEDGYSNQLIYYIRDESDQVKAVIQSPGRFEQKYSTRWCKRPGRITYDTNNFVSGSHTLTNFNVTCTNTYMDFEFFVLSSKGRVEVAKAKGGIPVCCKCMYSKLH